MKHKAILLIDDDEDDQLIFVDAVKEVNPGIVCLTADNGGDAYLQLEKSSPAPSLIFLDLNMPVMNGFEFLERIKKSERFKNIPVVIYTTSDSPIDKKNTIDAGAVLFFTKTADFKLLKRKLDEILQNDSYN
jgi:CheY-like chemotaxis protein